MKHYRTVYDTNVSTQRRAERENLGGRGAVVVDQRDIDLIASCSQPYQLIRLSKQLRHRGSGAEY